MWDTTSQLPSPCDESLQGDTDHSQGSGGLGSTETLLLISGIKSGSLFKDSGPGIRPEGGGSREAWACPLASVNAPQPHCGTLSAWLNLSGPQFPRSDVE